jgi:hypothetical protein
VNFIKRSNQTDKQWQNSHRDTVRFERREMDINDVPLVQGRKVS